MRHNIGHPNLPAQLLYNDFVNHEPRLFFDRHKKNCGEGIGEG